MKDCWEGDDEATIFFSYQYYTLNYNSFPGVAENFAEKRSLQLTTNIIKQNHTRGYLITCQLNFCIDDR